MTDATEDPPPATIGRNPLEVVGIHQSQFRGDVDPRLCQADVRGSDVENHRVAGAIGASNQNHRTGLMFEGAQHIVWLCWP